ncbi:MAG TPA: TVP38/TMEM64 family protein [Verrucomicrobiae bacterium]|nr:TVP38/TMEM64 family protein [Verrucomicrobiae bacterium]
MAILENSATGKRQIGGAGRILVVMVVATLIVLGLLARPWLNTALEWARGFGAAGWVVFVVLYVIATVLLIPGSALTLGAGALYGVAAGSALVSVASTLGATAAFLAGRHLARDWVARKLAGRSVFATMDRAVAEDGWKIVFLARLSPLFPFTLLNYAFGVTRVGLGTYIIASWIGMMPGTVMYVYLGSLAQTVAGRERTPAQWILYGAGLIATVVVTLLVTRIARRALDQRTGPESPAHG